MPNQFKIMIITLLRQRALRLIVLRIKKQNSLSAVVGENDNRMTMTHFFRLIRHSLLAFFHHPIAHRGSSQYKKIFFGIMMMSLVFSPVMLKAQSLSAILFSSHGEGENIIVAIENAQKILNKKIYKKSRIPQQVNQHDFNLSSDLLTVQKLGRTAGGKKTKITLRLTKNNYLNILRYLEKSIRQKLHADKPWSQGVLGRLNQTLASLNAFIHLDVGHSLKNIQSSHKEQYLVLKEQLSRFVSQSSIRFIGEVQGAEIYMNGIKHSNSYEIDNLLPGKHIFTISKPNYLSVQGEVYLNPGEKSSFFISFIKSPKTFINVQLNVDASLHAYQEYINSLLQELGMENMKKEEGASLELSLYLDTSQITFGDNNTIHKKKYLLSIEVSKTDNPETIFNDNWYQVYNFFIKSNGNPLDEKKESHRVKDVIQKGLYYFYQKQSAELRRIVESQ